MIAHREVLIGPGRYRPRTGGTARDYASEQDVAAGGRDARLVVRGDGTHAAASVAPRCYQTKHRGCGYPRWTEGKSTREKYFGDVSDCPDRASAVRASWQRARAAQSTNLTDTPVPARRD